MRCHWQSCARQAHACRWAGRAAGWVVELATRYTRPKSVKGGRVMFPRRGTGYIAGARARDGISLQSAAEISRAILAGNCRDFEDTGPLARRR